MDHDAYQELNARCQEVIAREGMLHIAAVAPVTKEFTKQLGLRDGWKEAMSSLASKGVPIYLFSSGYGDVVTQVLIQGLADSSSSSSSSAGSSNNNPPMSSGKLYYLSSSSSSLHHRYSTSVISMLISSIVHHVYLSNFLSIISIYLYHIYLSIYIIFFLSSSGTSTLPQNIRIISNFFRTAPDGTVRAFSQPIIHERYVKDNSVRTVNARNLTHCFLLSS